ncbi:glycosyltransferase family 2 protein [Neobacillus bataviensis]|uniref:glycosyltransferase family 2 protein n=1 Tax=Neobacillus bataviensis TaxID=220685 RepID=UPI001CC0D3DB|nr:glycosyltransferase [Neobacillus bataviensis]
MSILVSINCITYNHEDYIADALESFLMQKTKFDFEIVIGEDCSTDKTREIVEHYINKYPEKIRLITSEANVGSQKNLLRIAEQSKGKYIALCEGDDYWTDPYKLQKQIDYMEENTDCSLCVHASEIVEQDKSPTGKYVKPYYGNKVVEIGEVILGGGGLFPTASIVYPKQLMDNPPEFFGNGIVGDYPLVMILANKGKVFYIDEIMSAYRTGVFGSWSQRNLSGENLSAKIIKNAKGLIWILERFNEYSEYKYSTSIDFLISKNKALILLEQKDTMFFKTQYFKDLTLIKKVKMYTLINFPSLYSNLAKLSKKYSK